MKTPNDNTQTDLSWVDYCDSLSEEYFSRYVQKRNSVPAAEKLPEPVSIAVARQESAREIA